MLYTDLFKMIADVRQSIAAGDRVVNYDNPMSRHVGYQGLTEEWSIGLLDLKRLYGNPDLTLEQEEVRDKMRSVEGRLEVVYGVR